MDIFNKILICEEASMQRVCRDLSVTEIHIIATVRQLAESEMNTMKNIAQKISLSAAASTIAVNNLVKKGYINRKSFDFDRRKVFVFLTEKGEKVNEYHTLFHKKMIHSILSEIPSEEIATLERSLSSLKQFFSDKIEF